VVHHYVGRLETETVRSKEFFFAVPGVGAAKQKEEAIQVPLDSFEYIRQLLDRNRHTGKTPVVRRARQSKFGPMDGECLRVAGSDGKSPGADFSYPFCLL